MTNQLTTEFSDRLITLSDGRAGLRGAMHVEVRENSCNSCLDFTASDETLDRYGEIISASGWRLENYRRNPVFQNAHQYGDVIFTLGKALATEVRDGSLSQRIEFATEVNPMARIAYGLYKGKFLNAVSVGFVPIRWQDGSQKSIAPNEIRNTEYGTRAPESSSCSATTRQPRRIYLEQELLEVSAVGIPANPNALALGLKSGAIEKTDLQELREVIGKTLAHARSRDGHVASMPTPPAINYPKLLELARELLRVLRHT
jgi:hypothetical protein